MSLQKVGLDDIKGEDKMVEWFICNFQFSCLNPLEVSKQHHFNLKKKKLWELTGSTIGLTAGLPV